jgi:proline iminopeptidase
MDRSLWTVERFVRELAEVRESLGLAKVHLLGHSWGSALVTTYVLKTHPQGVESITLASPYLSTRLWNADAARLRAQLPPEVQQTLERHERAGTLQSPEYQEAVGVYHDRHLFHRKVEPIPSCAEAPKNNEIYQRMWGGSDFYSTGVLKDFDLIPYLEELKNPVLLLTGRYDTARPETAALLQTMIPGARLSILENSAHMGPMEEPERMSELIETFLRDIELSASR